MSKPSILLVNCAAIVIIIAGLIAAKSIVLPFLLAIFFSILFSALQNWMLKHGFPSWLAIPLTITITLVTFVILINFFTTSIKSFIEDSPQLRIQLQLVFDQLSLYLPELGQSGLKDILQPETAFGFFKTSLNSILSLMNNMFLVILLVLFMLVEAAQLRKKLTMINNQEAAKIFDNFVIKVKHYMLYKVLFSVITGVSAGIGLWSLSVSYATLWGLLTFLLNFIPTIGSIVAAIPPVLLALVNGGIVDASLVAVLYLIINIVVGNILEPRFMGKGMGLSALMVFLSLIFWGWTFGVVGMFLSVPLTMIIKIGLESSPKYTRFATWLNP